jgi:hypothetical protein
MFSAAFLEASRAEMLLNEYCTQTLLTVAGTFLDNVRPYVQGHKDGMRLPSTSYLSFIQHS